MSEKWKILIIAALGSTLELYDFSLYAVMVQVLAQHFFPQSDHQLALLASLAAFASGFLIRPIAAIAWGHLGDRKGRGFALSYTMLAMAIPTFVIGLLPTYAQIGFGATIALVCCRILQGASMSGEFNGAMIFILEHHTAAERGYVCGIICAINTAGILIATYFALWVSDPNRSEWAWRLPFLFGAVIAVSAYFIRKRLAETPIYQQLFLHKQIVKNPFKTSLHYKSAMMMTFIQSAFNGMITYTMISFLHIYFAQILGLSAKSVLILSVLMLLSSALCEILCGKIIDKLGITQTIRYGIYLLLIGLLPAFALMLTKNMILLGVAVIMCGIFLAAVAVTTHSYIQGLFPAQVRYTGIAVWYNLGMCVLGGTIPLILTWSFDQTQMLLMPPIILLIATLVYQLCFEYFQKRQKI